MSDTETSDYDTTFKIGVSLWLSFCIFACLWFLSRFVTGRKQLKNNLHVIEDGLRRMQEDIERRQREGHTEYGENLEELAEELFKSYKKPVGIALAAWVLIKLVYACFWLPKHLKKEDEKQKQEETLPAEENEEGNAEAEEKSADLSGDEKEEEYPDKKND